MTDSGEHGAPAGERKPQKWPLCSDADEFLYAESEFIITRHALPHRAVWGMVYNPAEGRWLIRQTDSVTGFWDVSCGDHVLIVDSRPESYDDAYARALHALLGLETAWLSRAEAETGGIVLAGERTLTIDMGYSKEYNWTFSWQRRSLHLEREHVHIYLTLYAGDVAAVSAASPGVFEWANAERIWRETETSNSTTALAHAFARCQRFVSQVDVQVGDAPDDASE